MFMDVKDHQKESESKANITLIDTTHYSDTKIGI